jgi:hypothetical protein
MKRFHEDRGERIVGKARLRSRKKKRIQPLLPPLLPVPEDPPPLPGYQYQPYASSVPPPQSIPPQYNPIPPPTDEPQPEPVAPPLAPTPPHVPLPRVRVEPIRVPLPKNKVDPFPNEVKIIIRESEKDKIKENIDLPISTDPLPGGAFKKIQILN